jgi:endonuclease/exonuclease/phosphatase (EEP) superfamily protein YafD
MKFLASAVLIPGLAVVAAACLLASRVTALEPATELAPWITLFAATVAFAGFLMRGRFPLWASAASLGVAAVLTVSFLPVALRINDTLPASGQQSDVRILSLNVWFENKDLTRIIELVRAEQPDVIILTEAGEAALGRLSERLSDYPTRFTCEKMPYCGVAIFSKLRGRALPGGADLAGGLTRPPGDWGVIPLAAAELQLPDGEWFPVAAAHALRRGGASADDDSIREVARFAASLPNADAAVLAGDFNSSDWSWALRRIDDSLPLQRRTFGVRTWPAPSSPIRSTIPASVFGIDHVFTGAGWQTVDVRRGPDVGSDHYPVLSAFRRAPDRLPAAGE